MLKSVFCVDLTAFVRVHFGRNYVKAKKDRPPLSPTKNVAMDCSFWGHRPKNYS